MSPTLRERLNAVRRRTGEARDRIVAAKRAQDDARAQVVDAANPQDPGVVAYSVAQQQQAAAQADLDAAKNEESFLLSQAAGLDNTFRRESFLSDPRQMEELQSLAHQTSTPIGSVKIGTAMSAEELLNRIQSGDWGRPSRMAAAGYGSALVEDNIRRGGPYGIINELPRRRLRILDLVPSQPMDGLSFSYSQEVAVSDASGTSQGAEETVEGAIAPATTLDFQDAEAKAATISHYTKMLRNQLADLPSLQQVVEGRLVWGVLRRLEDQIIGGDGLGQNLRGILNTSGIAAVEYDSAVPLVELPLTGEVDVLLADAEPNAVIVSPTDWATMLTAKSVGSGEYVGNGPFGAGARTLWDLPCIPSKAVPAGTALVGDFSNGLTLFVREGVGVRPPTATRTTS